MLLYHAYAIIVRMNQPQTTEILLQQQRVPFVQDFPGGSVDRQFVEVPSMLVSPDRLDENVRAIEFIHQATDAAGGLDVDSAALVYNGLLNRSPVDKEGNAREPLSPEQRLAITRRVEQRWNWRNENTRRKALGQDPQPWPFD